MTDPSEPLVPQPARSPGVPIREVGADAAPVRIADREPPLPDGFEERPLPAAPAA